jgi:hypothetical protein
MLSVKKSSRYILILMIIENYSCQQTSVLV